ncbi:MAG: YCF48-related protein [Planctomycetota bacterium]
MVQSLVLCSFLSLCSGLVASDWTLVSPDSESSLRGAGVTDTLICVAGSGPQVWVSKDAGGTWHDRTPEIPGVSDYRCVEVVANPSSDENVLLIASAGTPAVILRSEDAGETWKTVYENQKPAAFLDSLRFWDADHGIAFGDPIDGRFLLLKTRDGGKSWQDLACPIDPLEGEAGFAASNGSISLAGTNTVLIGLGGRIDQGPSRMLRSTDQGNHWDVIELAKIPAGPSSGIFAVSLRADGFGIAVGGDYKRPEDSGGNIAVTEDGGQTWRSVTGQGPRGYRSSVIRFQSKDGEGQTTDVWMTTGPSGSEVSVDGEDWQPYRKSGFHALRRIMTGVLACGSDGRVALTKAAQ